MKTAFESFLAPNVDSLRNAWSSASTIFVFDTNVFLNLYGYEDRTRTDFFSTAIKLKDKVWIPHHVGLEYHRNRLKVIKREKKVFRDINAFLEKINTSINSELQKLGLAKKFPEIHTNLHDLASKIKEHVEEAKSKISPWDIKQADVRSDDQILESLHEITHDRIGPPPSEQKWLDDLYAEGKVRYAEETPPGFEDRSKADGEKDVASFTHGQLKYERAYGDLIIWKQLLSKATSPEVESVFFITDDAKKDWWSVIDSAGEKIIGPHESLKSEICRTSNVSFFHMYSTSDFLKDGKQFLNVDILESSINDAHDKSELTAETEEESDQTGPLLEGVDLTKEQMRLIESLFGRSRYLDNISSNNQSLFDSVSLENKMNSRGHFTPRHYKGFYRDAPSANSVKTDVSIERDPKQKDVEQFGKTGGAAPGLSASHPDFNTNPESSTDMTGSSKSDCKDEGVD